MNVWHTSDLHLGHQVVAAYRWREMYPSIPAPDGELLTRWHAGLLARRWGESVAKDDLVFVHGDLALANTHHRLAAVLRWIQERPGRKRLYPGNHDPVHAMHRGSGKWHRAYYEVFETVEMFGRRRLTLSDGTTRDAWCSHFPYTDDHGDVERHPEARLRDCGHWLLHGHLHATSPVDRSRPRQIDVGVDAHAFGPVAEIELARMIEFMEQEYGW